MIEFICLSIFSAISFSSAAILSYKNKKLIKRVKQLEEVILSDPEKMAALLVPPKNTAEMVMKTFESLNNHLLARDAMREARRLHGLDP